MNIKSFPVAILQGRLSPDLEDRYQFFPAENWQNEFLLAREIGFEGIEWLIDPKFWEKNPIFTQVYDEVETLAEKTHIPIVSVCADWFMEVCLWEGDPDVHRNRIRSIFPHVAKTTNKLILLPLLETHNISNQEVQHKVIKVLKPLAPEMERLGIHIGFETELTAKQLISFLLEFESDAFGVYYDVGNCTSYGFDCPRDIQLLGSRIKGVHAKDRKIGTSKSVLLGEGDANYQGVLSMLTEINWQGTLVMQAWRGKDYLDDARRQLEFLRSFFSN